MHSHRRLSTSSVSPDWRSASSYEALIGADRSAYAWEWTRRSRAYRDSWHAQLNGPSSPPQSFGLERFEDPDLPVPVARPIWTAEICPDVLRAHVSDPFAARRERVDLRLLAQHVTVAIGLDEVEHLLLADGRRFIRIDVVAGTLIGCPAALTYLLHGLSGLKGPVAALERLASLVRRGGFASDRVVARERHLRWISALRVADALEAGATQQEMARVFFGSLVSTSRWRSESGSYRNRVQRLVETARYRLAYPLDGWFTGPRG